MTDPGRLRERVAFDEITPAASTEGIKAGSWTERFQRDARIRPLVGTEPVIAQRLTGVQPIVITVRSDSSTRTITTDWRARNTRSGQSFQIRAVTPDEKRHWIDLLCEYGPATNG